MAAISYSTWWTVTRPGLSLGKKGVQVKWPLTMIPAGHMISTTLWTLVIHRLSLRTNLSLKLLRRGKFKLMEKILKEISWGSYTERMFERWDELNAIRTIQSIKSLYRRNSLMALNSFSSFLRRTTSTLSDLKRTSLQYVTRSREPNEIVSSRCKRQSWTNL